MKSGSTAKKKKKKKCTKTIKETRAEKSLPF